MPGLAGKPRPALLLVNDEDLSYAKVRLDPRSEATVRGSLDRLSDPMARALCWTALWDSARRRGHAGVPVRRRRHSASDPPKPASACC